MNREEIARVRRRVQEEEARVAAQRRLIETLRAKGQPTEQADSLLRELEGALRRHRAELDRLVYVARPD